MSKKTLSKIFIYPIKSLGGIALQSTELTSKGARWDRRWMLVDNNGRFLSQRELGQMVFLQPFLEADHLRIEDRRGGRAAFEIPLQEKVEAKRREVSIWRDKCPAIGVSESANQWFSEALGQDCHLVYMPDDSFRAIDPEYAKESESVSFADGYPYLILGEASMADLNRRLASPIEVERFRPNLVFTGGEAFEEDHWKAFTIGNAHFRGTKPCARCQVPTIDSTTGLSGKEPTKTLAGFRRMKNKINFGLNACWELDNTGAGNRLSIGETIQLY